jgi:hypothetical protein
MAPVVRVSMTVVPSMTACMGWPACPVKGSPVTVSGKSCTWVWLWLAVLFSWLTLLLRADTQTVLGCHTQYIGAYNNTFAAHNTIC